VKVNEAIERPWRYWIEDGVVEFALGFLCFLTGAIFWFGQTLDRGSAFADVYTVAAPCVCGVVWATPIWGMRKLKERVILPRAGYVSVSESVRLVRRNSIGLAKINFSSKSLPLASVAVLGAWAFLEARDELWLNDPGRWGSIIGVSLAAWLAVCFALAALQFKAERFLWLVALALAIGWWTYGKGNDPALDLMIMMTWLGGGSALIGAWRLRKFVSANPPVEVGPE
jgi:hypothetical protein